MSTRYIGKKSVKKQAGCRLIDGYGEWKKGKQNYADCCIISESITILLSYLIQQRLSKFYEKESSKEVIESIHFDTLICLLTGPNVYDA